MAKDKKEKKDKGAKKGKKAKAKSTGVLRAKSAKTATQKIKDWSTNPMVSHVVAASLVAAAAALKDSRKAQRLAAEAGDEIEKLSKKSAERGNALWQMALEIGRRSLEELADGGKSGRKPTASRNATARKKSAR